jgi:hypothetical protein
MYSNNTMDLSDLINQLGGLIINTSNNDDIIKKIIIFMHEASELGKNDYTFFFQDKNIIQTIIQTLMYNFPDIHIHYLENTDYIFIDWS